MKQNIVLKLIGLVCLCLIGWLVAQGIFWYRDTSAARAAQRAQDAAIADIIDSRRSTDISTTEVADVFDESGRVRILFIGLDKRTGQVAGHCDAIQMITIDREQDIVDITAVPRGSYSNLPPGTGTTSTDYYVSNACALGGLEYGIQQIEFLVGHKADYIAVVGFSETLGILRKLRLPTTETLQWLRHRQGYAIGEPQRAHNHSTFIKQMITRFVPADSNKIDTALHYIIYKMIKTDLTFEQVEHIIAELSQMDLGDNPDRIRLNMRPYYEVQDIPYDEEQAGVYVESMIGPIKQWITNHGYTGATVEDAQSQILAIIEDKKEDTEFITWAYDNNLWYQIEDEDTRMQLHYDFVLSYSEMQEEDKRKQVIADYIIEMEYYNQDEWVEKGKQLLLEEVDIQ